MIVVVTTVSERVHRCDIYARSIAFDLAFAPSIVAVSRTYGSGFIRDRNNIALQVLIEIICSFVIFQTANRSVEIIQIFVYISVAIAAIVGYDLFENVGAVKDVFMGFAVLNLFNSDSIVVILVSIISELFELSALLPSQRIAAIIGRVAVDFIISHRSNFVNEKLHPRRGGEKNFLFRQPEKFYHK